MTTLVCRDREGNEIARQSCQNEAEAIRLMFARNRPLAHRVARYGGEASTFSTWAIETEIQEAANQ